MDLLSIHQPCLWGLIGNALIDDETYESGLYDFYWTHAFIPDEIHQGIISNCNFTPGAPDSPACDNYKIQAGDAIRDIYGYNIYAPYCTSPPSPNPYSDVGFAPCSDNYIQSYLNLPQVQKALHANVTSLPYPWTSCSSVIPTWNDRPTTILPVIQQLVASQIRVWIYSGDVDGVIPLTSTRYSINAMKLSIDSLVPLVLSDRGWRVCGGISRSCIRDCKVFWTFCSKLPASKGTYHVLILHTRGSSTFLLETDQHTFGT